MEWANRNLTKFSSALGRQTRAAMPSGPPSSSEEMVLDTGRWGEGGAGSELSKGPAMCLELYV